MASNEKFQPGEEMFEDVEGHGARHPLDGEQPTGEDTEGHALRRAEGDAEDEDTEGHALRRAQGDAEDEDTEGHAGKFRF